MGFTEVLGGLANILNPLDGIKDTITDLVHSFKGDPAVLKELQLKEIEARLKVDIAKAEIRTKLEDVYVKDLASLREQIKVELQSQDPFVRRARPAWLWGLLSIYWMNYGLTAIIHPFVVEIQPLDFPYELHLLTVALVGGYGVMRTLEKHGIKSGRLK